MRIDADRLESVGMPGSRQPSARTVKARARLDQNALAPMVDFPVIGIGASAGGLQACTKLLEAIPAECAAAWILVQHLDPTHESMMVELLGKHTNMAVLQAVDGALIEPGKLYVIPPGKYLSVKHGELRLSQPTARHGARLPFDFLLHSLAEEFGERAVCLVLSGTGADGCAGLKKINDGGGFVVAQDPDEAGYDGMPRNAVLTGVVDVVLAVAEIPRAIMTRECERGRARAPETLVRPETPDDWLACVIDLLRAETAHDFTLYKPGTLRRRIERRIAMTTIKNGDKNAYLDILRTDPAERDLLARDLLINVTSFFRDPKVFDLLSRKTLPDLLHGQARDHALRVWIAGCSTGEEAYSLAMLFREQITTQTSVMKLQVFASDIDPDAVAFAREGLYPETIASDVSPTRLSRFFTKEENGYRVSPELRAAVVFTTHDLLADPPFSRLDFVSCRNLLIYLLPEAQAKVISLFHFALWEGGVLLLGNSETIGNGVGNFEAISKPERLYRRIGGRRSEPLSFSMGRSDGVRTPPRVGGDAATLRPATLAALCQRIVADDFGPATALINGKHECLYFSGRTDDYLKVAPGNALHDILSMAREGVRTRLLSVIQRATDERKKVSVSGGRMVRDGVDVAFGITAQPVSSEGSDLLLVYFIEEPKPRHARNFDAPHTAQDLTRIAELEQEVASARAELRESNRHLETVGEEQKAINEEAMSVNEEYQSTNEELTTSKEELQSLNEELTALNNQLQETLERQRTTFNDLQNILYSTDVATLFLDKALHIRFFTPATRLLFNVIPSDVGRPLADLSSLAVDEALLTDAATVLQTLAPLEREIETGAGAWYLRRILPYRTQDTLVEGVVVTFVDVTERRHIADALEVARKEAEVATMAKSRFLAAASHDLRQPLQTLVLLQGILAKSVLGDKEKKLVRRLGEAADAMSGMLNALLDINQIEAGSVEPHPVSFPVNDLFDRLRDEFTYHAQSRRLSFHVVPCGLTLNTDPRLFEQIVRNLLTNAMKYTRGGKVLLGCRRRRGTLIVEVWDTGIGIPESEYQTIFEEYRQIDNEARERSRGLGLGLFIVARLAKLLDFKVLVRSRIGKGSVFSIEIKLPITGTPVQSLRERLATERAHVDLGLDARIILVIEDDPDVRELLEFFLAESGHRVTSAPDGVAALDLVVRGLANPDFILADYNLPNGMNGLATIGKVREALARDIPAIILTGDISTETLHAISGYGCEELNKPVKLDELTQAIARLLQPARSAPDVHPPKVTEGIGATGLPTIFVVDDDEQVRAAIRAVLEDDGHAVEDFAACEAFLGVYRPGREGCLLVDAYLPGMNGLELLKRLADMGAQLPSIMITGNGDVAMAVQAMKAGVLDFIEKPVGRDELLASVERALEQSRDTSKTVAWRASAASHIAGLTERQREIMELVLAGHPSKNIAADLGISQRTVENHRASIMKRTGTKSLPALARLALAAAGAESASGPKYPKTA